MRIGFSNGTFICRCTFESRHLPKDAGFFWDKNKKIWFTEKFGVAARLDSYFDESAKKEIARVRIEIDPWLGGLAVPATEELKPFQTESALFALSRNRSYLGLDPGLGKTPTAAVIAATLTKKQRLTGVFYICPPFLTRNTSEEFLKWAPGLEFMIIPDSMITKDKTFNEINQTVKWFKERKIPTVLFVDEAHRFKNDDAKRTQFLFGNGRTTGIATMFDRVVYLSGTPMPNRPIELFPVLNHSAPDTISYMGKFDYAVKYCAAHQNQWGWDYTGASNVKELVQNVIGKFMIRFKKADVLKDLPPKIEEMVVLNEGLTPRLTKLSNEILKTLSPDDLLKGQISVDLGKEVLHLSTYRKELGNFKAKAAAEFIKFVLDETEENVLVFAIHKEVIATLNDELLIFNPIVITGDTEMRLRHERVKDFQTNPERRLFIGNINAAGTGFTLTKATRVIFAEFSWAPSDNDQASDRAHRIGQTDNVFVQYLVCENSVDKAVIETVLRKKKVTAQL